MPDDVLKAVARKVAGAIREAEVCDGDVGAALAALRDMGLGELLETSQQLREIYGSETSQLCAEWDAAKQKVAAWRKQSERLVREQKDRADVDEQSPTTDFMRGRAEGRRAVVVALAKLIGED